MAAVPDDVHPSILQLAEGILAGTKQLADALVSSGVGLPTFSATSPALQMPTDPGFQDLQIRLKTQLEDLSLLVQGPSIFYRHHVLSGYELGAFQLALDFKFFDLIPTEGDISLADLAQKSGLDQDLTNRIIRMLITQRIFQESKAGYFAHNVFSIALQRDEEMKSMVHYSFDEVLKACASSNDTINAKAMPFEADSQHCPFSQHFGTSIYEYYKQNAEKARRFAKAMAGWRKMTCVINDLKDIYPWAKLEQGTVVDIGGGSGHISMELARVFPQLKFVIQDGDAAALAVGQRAVSADDSLSGRFSFMETDFLKAQPCTQAAAFLLRQCTHNWADKDVVKMFQAIVPGLEGSPPGTPLLINEMILPEAGDKVPRIWERERRQADMVMMVCCGAKERTLSDMGSLLKEADSRYVIRQVYAEKREMALLEVHLER